MSAMPASRRLTLRRGIAVPALLLVAMLGLVLGGCTALTKAQSAAIVNGQPITNEDVATAAHEFNTYIVTDPSQAVTEARVLSYLILAPFVLAEAERTGAWKPDESYNNTIAKIPQASQPTKDLIATSLAAQALSQDGVTAVLDQLKKADVQLDPRYGTFDPSTGGSLAEAPNWIKTTPTSAATTAAGQ